jgi:hypothetical protein
VDDAVEQSKAETEISTAEPVALENLNHSATSVKEKNKPEAEKGQKAAAPRESAVVANFKKFYRGQDTSKQHDTAADQNEEADNQIAEAGEGSKVQSFEHSATDGENLIVDKGTPAEIEAAAPRESMLSASFNFLFGGQADDDSSRPSKHDDDLSALIDNLDSTNSRDKEETKQQFRGESRL